jgi:hypothetical protein
MPFESGEDFLGFDDVRRARRRKQERRLRQLYFMFKTTPDLETRLWAALEADALFEEIYGCDDDDPEAANDDEAVA